MPAVVLLPLIQWSGHAGTTVQDTARYRAVCCPRLWAWRPRRIQTMAPGAGRSVTRTFTKGAWAQDWAHSSSALRSRVSLSCRARIFIARCRYPRTVPSLPVASVQDIARRRGIRYPLYAGTTVPYVMTTGFVVTVKSDDGSVSEFARTVKYAGELAPDNRLARTLGKLELEKAFWA